MINLKVGDIVKWYANDTHGVVIDIVEETLNIYRVRWFLDNCEEEEYYSDPLIKVST